MRLVHREYGADFLARVEKILIPVGLRLVDVKVGIVIERDLERAGFADVPLRLPQTALQFAALFAGELGVFEFFENLVEFLFGHLARGEQNQLLAGLARHFEEGAVVRDSVPCPR